ncbi:short-chain dehydrogenase/reductase SDR [Penicillium brevicompactum]|uniref:Short-chain dehydrogenase/reductase SDR n=1 Tax=Penicillium brevicompactum TaxID=5074 RepID=A0A9W9RKX6_PENBR|nr:short-chain dehydrogenase/reductase SDR [Penicillium brevicompactum]
MQPLLESKVIAITGCSSGIGRAIAIACAQHGATLILHHLGTAQTDTDVQSLLSEISKEHGASPTSHIIIGCDLTSEGAAEKIIETAVSTYGRLDSLVNNAGICRFEPAAAVSSELLNRHMDINYKAVYYLTRAATSQMMHQGTGGSIVQISSITALFGSAGLTHYAPTKAALLAMSKAFAVEFGRHGIRYNCVLPATTPTGMTSDYLSDTNKRSSLEERVPLGRLGRPTDIAGPVVFFASDLSGFISGEELLVDGAASVNYQ